MLPIPANSEFIVQFAETKNDAGTLEPRATTVAVVDSHPADYAVFPQAMQRFRTKWRFLATGQEALRLARSEYVDLWVVNVVLVDISGIDLCGMLRSRSPPPAVYMVTDAYRAEDERAARAAGAAMFGCKPITMEWFDNRRRAA
jgi:DNA-binding response OmpR family regulator